MIKGQNKIKKSSALTYLFIFILTISPTVSLGPLEVEIFEIIIIAICGYFLLTKKFSKCYLLFIFYSWIIISAIYFIGLYINNTINYSVFIDQSWFDLYGAERFDFYHKFPKSLTYIIRIFVLFIVFALGQNYYSGIKNNLVSFVLGLNVLIMLFQIFHLNEYRPGGLLKNAQAVSAYAILLTSVLYKVNFTILILLLTVVILSGTRSAIVVLVILFIYNKLSISAKNILNLALLLFGVLFSIIFPILLSDQIDSILSVINVVFDSVLTMRIRFIMWESFSNVISSNPIFGTMGSIPRFYDNIFWNFTLPYGLTGLIILIIIAYSNLKSKNEMVKVVFFIFLLQGMTYDGFLISPLSYTYWFIYGGVYGKSTYLHSSI